MKLACADFAFPLLEHEHALDLIRMLEFDAIDLAMMGNRSHVRPEIVQKDPDGWIEKLRERLRSRELQIADFFLIPWTDFERMAPNNPDARERDESESLFNAMSDMAVALEAGGMTMLPGIHWPGESWDESFNRAVSALSLRTARAQEKGLRLSVEPHFGSIADTPDRALALVDAVPGLELTVDYTHFVFQGIPESEIEPMIEHARHFHARGCKEGRLQTTLRENTIDYERIIDVMKATGYDGYVGIEYVWHPHDPPGSAYDLTNTDNISETILLRNRITAKTDSVA